MHNKSIELTKVNLAADATVLQCLQNRLHLATVSLRKGAGQQFEVWHPSHQRLDKVLDGQIEAMIGNEGSAKVEAFQVDQLAVREVRQLQTHDGTTSNGQLGQMLKARQLANGR